MQSKTVKIATTCVVLLFFACLALLIPKEQEPRFLIDSSHEDYFNIISPSLDGQKVAFTEQSALSEFRYGDSIALYDYQAAELLPNLEGYTFTPHLSETVVIALDRSYTDHHIDSFSDILKTDLVVSFDLEDKFNYNDYGSPRARHIMLAMSEALYDSYDTQSLGEFMLYLEQDGERFCYLDMWQPIIITTDKKAATLISQGREIEVVIPEDGTTTVHYGILSKDLNIPLDSKLSTSLITAGYRTAKGEADSALYPTDYQDAHFIENDLDFRGSSASVSADIRRATFEEDLYGFTNLVEISVAFTLLCFVVILYLFSIIRRVTDKRIERAFVGIAALQVLFLMLGLIKMIVVDNPFLETVLWYAFYIPMLFMPALLVYVMIVSRYKGDHIERIMGLYKLYLGVTAALLLLVFTNSIHGLIFIITDYEHSYHDYNFGYFFVLGWIYFSILISVVSLIKQCFTSPRKALFLYPVMMIALMLVYSYGFIYSVEFIIKLELGFAITIMAIIFSEFCMLSRLIPHNQGYRRLFYNSNLAMKVEDKNKNTVESSLVAAALDQNYVLKKSKITGGTFLYFEDHTSLNNTSRQLAEINEKRRANNEFLLQKGKVNADIAAVTAEGNVYASIDNVLLSGTAKIESLVAQISKNSDHKRTMATINMLACIMKRECMLRINMLHRKEQTVEVFLSALAEMQVFAKDLGIDLIFSCQVAEFLPTAQAHAMYSLCAAAIERAAALYCCSVVVQIYKEEGQAVLSVFADLPLFKDGNITHENPHYTVSAKPWEDTEVYRLTEVNA